jgi:sugar (pentulose or hexulose) kinase
MAREGMLLGFDVGSSSIKAALLDAATGRPAATAA